MKTLKHFLIIFAAVLGLGWPAMAQTLSNPAWITNRPTVVLTADLKSHLNVNGSPIVGYVQTSVNVVLSSSELTLFTTNNFTFGTSNFIARVPQLYDWNLIPGQLGGGGVTFSTNVFEQLCGSYNGTVWFVLTNGFTTTNAISLAVVGAGGGVGALTLFGLDHWELLGHTNSFFGQHLQFGTPQNPSDAATKFYVDSMLHILAPPVQLAGGWLFDSQAPTLTNQTVSFIANNVVIFQLMANVTGAPIDSFTPIITSTNTWTDGTNWFFNYTVGQAALQVAQTNLPVGWLVEACTNFMPPVLWLTFTNYTSVTNSGELTLTVPLNTNLVAQFFRIHSPLFASATFTVPLKLAGGIFYPSNTWNLAAITNTMPDRSLWQGYSNDTLVTLSLSNGVVRYLPTGTSLVNGPTNFIHDLNGYGTNTSLYFGITNSAYVFANLPGAELVLIGTNSIFAGTNYYVYDGDTGSAAYHNFPASIGYKKPGGGFMPPQVVPSSYGYPVAPVIVTNYPLAVWTNIVATNLFEINLVGPDPFGVGDTRQEIFCLVTNGGYYHLVNNAYPTFRADNWPLMAFTNWYAVNGASGSVLLSPASTYTLTTNTQSLTYNFIANGQFTPMTAIFFLDATSQIFVLIHGLGHTPHMIEWSFLCIYPDAGLETVPGEEIPIHDTESTFTLINSPTTVQLNVWTSFIGHEGAFTFRSKTDNAQNNPSSFTNFVLKVTFYP
jgi:hypothetical protein